MPAQARGGRGGERPALRYLTFGVACCAVELFPLVLDRYRPERWNIHAARGPGDANVLVVAGAVNRRLAPAVAELYRSLPEPRRVVAFSACACRGGPYHEGFWVLGGVDGTIPVDVYVPGSPPRPEALLHALLRLQERWAAGGVAAVRGLPPPAPRHTRRRR